jgi:hypothetical protein
MPHITVDEAIALLTKARDTVGGDACLILSLTGSGIEDADVNDLEIVKEEDSRYVSVRVNHPSIQLDITRAT